MGTYCLAMLVAGIAMLLLSLVQSARVVRQLPPGRARVMWWVLSGLIVAFIAGYSYECLGGARSGAGASSIVPVVFLLGAVFVLLATSFSLEAVLLLLPSTDAAGAETLAERLRGAVEGHGFGEGAEPAVRMTVSAGVAALSAASETAEALVAAADAALYRAKESGRNRVVVAGSER